MVVGGDCQSVKRRCVRIHICFHLFKLLFFSVLSFSVFLWSFSFHDFNDGSTVHGGWVFVLAMDRSLYGWMIGLVG